MAWSPHLSRTPKLEAVILVANSRSSKGESAKKCSYPAIVSDEERSAEMTERVPRLTTREVLAGLSGARIKPRIRHCIRDDYVGGKASRAFGERKELQANGDRQSIGRSSAAPL